MSASAAAALALATVVPLEAAKADTPQVSVETGVGMAHISWTAVDGAQRYEIERTLMNGSTPAGPGTIVGIWTPTRGGDNITQGPTVFADHGFVVGERYQWRVRPVIGGTPGDWSEPIVMSTPDHPGPSQYLTGHEMSDGVRYTTDAEEVELMTRIAADSPRVRLESLGTTYEGRPILAAVVGNPPGTPQQIAKNGSVLLAGNVHGTERSGREAGLTMLRRLAFSDEQWVTDLLSTTTVIIVPTQNPDGQANSQRSNISGQDLNRDHILLRHPEALGIAKVIRDYQPDIIVDAHENPGAGTDIQFLWPRSLAVESNLFTYNQMLVGRGSIYAKASEAGISPGQWGTHRVDNWETLLSNVSGLKNTVGLLVEVPWGATSAHPAEGVQGGPENLRRRTAAAYWAFETILDYHHENKATVKATKAGAAAYQSANTGPLYLDGAYPIPVSPPITDANTIMFQPYCGYRLSPEQYAARDGSDENATVSWKSAPVKDRLAAHGVVVENVGSGIVQVKLAQPLRGLIPFMLDPDLETSTVRPQGTPNIGMVDATRLDDRRSTVFVKGVSTGVPNRVGTDGCSVNDLIADEQAWPNKGQFVSHVNHVVNDLRGKGLLSNKEASAISKAVASGK
ncbi:hypothetical protein GCM10009584_12450 [Ornithinimicrobium humiphilum]|uniref:M14 family zinc carboxypeptidase n=1 Tax=Ornithinimicrobium humiphilum TaxID=125288 RepID=UPI001479628E|nr:M14 family zinc carboxypeptidase [Ornithinimicrobium humiphilum]